MNLRGVAEWELAVTGLVKGADMAAQKTVRQGAYAMKRSVRANISGPPRWEGHVNHPRGGGPGILTGRLLRSTSYGSIKKLGYGRYSTTLSAKRIYASKTEHHYPYFQPGVRRVEGEVDAIARRNYLEAMRL